jgi:hypothetical protein
MACASRQPVPLVPGREQVADQVVSRRGAPVLQQRGHVVLDLDHGPLDIVPVGAQGPDVELPLHPAGPLLQSLGVLVRRAEDGRDGQRGERPGDCGDEVTAAVRRRLGPQVLEEAPHHRAPAVRPPGRERRAYQGPQPPVLLTGEVQDVGVDVIREWPAGDTEELRDLPAGKRRRP